MLIAGEKGGQKPDQNIGVPILRRLANGEDIPLNLLSNKNIHPGGTK
jgi:hypothetical protein